EQRGKATTSGKNRLGRHVAFKLGSCTIAARPRRATVEVEIAYAADFCELVSHALAGEVFRAPVLVTPGRLWHYPGAALSCTLRYQNTPAQITIRNSSAACRWFSTAAPAWRPYLSRGSPQGADLSG